MAEAIVVADVTRRQAHRYPVAYASLGAPPVWSPDSGAVYVAASNGRLERIDTGTGTIASIARSGLDPALSPDGTRLAYWTTGECGDRGGIYIELPAKAPKRITNDCPVYGTSGPDVLSSSAGLYEIVEGLGGDDTLIGRGAPVVGDRLEGGPGDDVIEGFGSPDVADGGPGNDTIRGGGGDDVVIGGPGRDKLYGDGGSDSILARDGRRDYVDCGPNPGKQGSTRRGDTAYVDRLDVVHHCEKVFRSK